MAARLAVIMAAWLAVVTLAVGGIFDAATATGLITAHVDWYAGTHGLSVGTDTHYCSADLIGRNVFTVSCEVAQ